MNEEYTIKDRWTSRKFWAVMVWQAVFTWMFYHGKMPLELFEWVTTMLLGGLGVANVVQDYYHTKIKGGIK